MSAVSSTAAPAAATGAPFGGTTDGLPGIPVSENAAHLAQVYIGVTSMMMLFCVLAFGTRIYQRVLPVWKIGLDDYFIVAGFILTIADWAMFFPIMVPTPGIVSLDRSTLAGKNSWLAISVWGLSMTCIKISIALTLLRIQGNLRAWRIFLYAVMAVQAVYGVGNTLFNTAIACHPLEAAWNPFVPGGWCVSIEAMRAVSNLGSSINITTDVLLSLAPATFLRKLNRPLRERVFVCVLMGMGILASVSSIVKTVIVKDWGEPTTTEDWWATGVSICTWTALEQLLGVLAACVPSMKPILQRCLGVFGVSLTENRSQQRAAYYAAQGGTAASRARGDQAAASRNQAKDDFDRRFSRKAKDIYEEETCIDLPDLSREGSTRSLGDRSLDPGLSDWRGHSVEQLPTHAV